MERAPILITNRSDMLTYARISGVAYTIPPPSDQLPIGHDVWPPHHAQLVNAPTQLILPLHQESGPIAAAHPSQLHPADLNKDRGFVLPLTILSLARIFGGRVSLLLSLCSFVSQRLNNVVTCFSKFGSWGNRRLLLTRAYLSPATITRDTHRHR